MMVYQIGSITDLGVIIEERISKESNIMITSMPLSDASKAMAFDIDGAVQTYTLRGKYVDTESNIKTFVNNIRSLISGNQSSTLTFKSNIHDDVKVKILSLDISYSAGSISVEYTIKMVEANL